MSKSNSANKLAWSLVALLAVVVALLALRPWATNDHRGNTEPSVDIAPEIAEVLKLHEDQEWSKAISKWNDLLKREDLLARQASEIRRHRRNAKEALDANMEGLTEFERPLGETQGRPELAATEDDFLAYYPVGRKVRSVAYFNVNGQGQNQAWILSGNVYFGYQYEMLMETSVKENAGNFAVFDVYVKDVKQVRAISEEKVELRIPEIDSPIISAVWKIADASLTYSSDTYRVVRKLGGMVVSADPRLRKTLTALNEFSKKAGIPLTDRKDVEIVEQVESLAGRQFEITYVRDLGVTRIKVVNGEALTQRQLEQLAYNSSVLMDYYVCPEAEQRAVGDRWEVQAEDVAGLISMDMNVRANGTISLEHGGMTDYKGQQCMDLHVVGGNVDAEFDTDSGRQTTTIRPAGGYIRFSPELKMVCGARLHWDMKEIEVSENHLLFGTSHVHEVSVESFYEAERMDTGTP